MDYKKLFIKLLDYRMGIVTTKQAHLLGVLKNLVGSVNRDDFNNQITRVIESNNTLGEMVFSLHKEYRQMDVFNTAEFDLMFWHLLSFDTINDTYKHFFHLIVDELPKLDGTEDENIEDLIHWVD